MNEKKERMKQKTISLDQLESYQEAGWRYVGAITDKKLVVERPIDESNPSKDPDGTDARKYFKSA